MHPLAFQFKHVHLAIVALGRKLFADDGLHHMTPARFDFFYAIYSRNGWRLEQREIRRHLGLSGATVSKTVKRLKELGLVTSTVAGDERQRSIRVTDHGRSLFMRAMTLVFRIRPIKRVFRRCAFGDRTISDQRRSWWKQILQFEDCLNTIAIFRAVWSARDGVENHNLPCLMLYRFKNNPFD